MSNGLDLSQFYETFFDEADELLADMERLLLALDAQAPDPAQLDAIFRAAHSIKGGAATFGVFGQLADTTHGLENVLDAVRRGELALHPEMIDVWLHARDVLKNQLDAYRAGQEPDASVSGQTCERLRALRAGTELTELPPSAGMPVAVADQEAALPVRVCFMGVKAEDLNSLQAELANLGTLLHVEQTPEQTSIWLDTACSHEDVQAVCGFIVNAAQMRVTREAVPDGRTPFAAAPATAAAAAGKAPAEAAKAERESSSIRVGVEKVDQIINLVGELVITQAMLAQTSTALDPVQHEQLLNGMEQLARNARDLQESVMSIRMMPMDYVFSRYPRMVRDAAAKLDKRITLHTEGGATELDKSLIERIIDPLTHLVRNSLDHGIEPPAERIAAGKPEVGTLSLGAQHSGGNIIIEISDDGRGLDRTRLLKKAAEKGLPVNDTASDEEVWQLIFAPGFSTAEAVTDLSGRGVGMDVVRRNIQDLGGHVQLFSRPGQGTTTRIVLPLTLAILDGMSVRVGAETFILPLNHVTESLQPATAQLHSVAGEARMLYVRGEYLPLVELHRFFAVPHAQTDPTRAIAIILNAEGQRFALLVDQLLAQHQVVVKNLESNYRKVPGIAAATILGDGSVALIVDVFALARVSREKTGAPRRMT